MRIMRAVRAAAENRICYAVGHIIGGFPAEPNLKRMLGVFVKLRQPQLFKLTLNIAEIKTGVLIRKNIQIRHMAYAYAAVTIVLGIMGEKIYISILIPHVIPTTVPPPGKAPAVAVVFIIVFIIRWNKPLMQLDMQNFLFIPYKLMIAFEHLIKAERSHNRACFSVLLISYKYIRVSH